jgi:hypothetical protein
MAFDCPFGLVCKSLTLTLEGCRKGVYSVPSERMGTLSSYPGAHEYWGPMLIYVCCILYVYMFNFIYIYSVYARATK